MIPVILSPEQVESLKYELIPRSAKIKLTRMLSRVANLWPTDDPRRISYMNRIINKANSIGEERICVLEPDVWGNYSEQEHAWHEGEFQLCIRRLDSVQFIEFLAELVESTDVTKGEANDLLSEAKSSVRFREDRGQAVVNVAPVAGDVNVDEGANPNLKTLVDRMDRDVDYEDYSAALSNCALAIEVISKETMASSSVDDQTFGSYFEGYKKTSGLPGVVVDWMLEIYKKRNEESLAGHGQRMLPTITGEEAVLIVEMTKAFIRYECWAASQL